MPSINALATAGAGGPETLPCKLFSDDIIDIVRVVSATTSNAVRLTEHSILPDPEAIGQTLFEMCLVRAVDSALAYITGVLQLVYQQVPEALKSKGEQIDIAQVLEFDSKSELLP